MLKLYEKCKEHVVSLLVLLMKHKKELGGLVTFFYWVATFVPRSLQNHKGIFKGYLPFTNF
ncbi:MAG: hypothetical protein U9R42_07330 [Bacteroidota bacterium]|nr:hypothetical protein [Bacteroidota bacterium]